MFIILNYKVISEDNNTNNHFMSEEQKEIESMTKKLIDFSKLGQAITKMS